MSTHSFDRSSSLRSLAIRAVATLTLGALCSHSWGADPLFSKLEPKETGIDYKHVWEMPDDWTLLNSYAPMAGVAMADYDGDGRLDLFLADQRQGGTLYRNLGDFRFEDATKSAGLDLKHRWTTGVSFADVNNDGHPDLFLGAHTRKNALFINHGDGTFRDASEGSGLDFGGATAMAAFVDYDRDGDLDCYLLTNHLAAAPGAKVEAKVENGKVILPEEVLEFKNIQYDKDGGYHLIDSGQRDYLFENDGSGKFRDVTRQMGLYGSTAPGLSAVWWDCNDDMWPDLYVSNDFYLYDQLWLNRDGKSFTDTHATTFPHQPWFSMGSDFADLNGDGRFDYIATDMSPSSHFRSKLTMGDMSADTWFLDSADPPQVMRNCVYLNGGKGQFMEVAQLLGLSSTDWTWAARASDLDCDGDQDLFFSTGMTRDFENSDHNDELQRLFSKVPSDDHAARSRIAREFWNTVPVQRDENFAFRNNGDLDFSEVTSEWGLDGLSVSSGVAIGDLDNDGDPDMVVMNFDDRPSFYRNNSNLKRFKVRLRGSESNKDGIGARLILTRKDGSEDHRFISLARGFLSSSGPETIFGLGDADQANMLRILWPSGKQQIIKEPKAGSTLVILEKDAASNVAEPIRPPVAPLMARNKWLDMVIHRENTGHDEFEKEPLLPQRVSQLGPGLAVADLNRDGHDDLFMTQASGQPTVLACTTESGLATITATQAELNKFPQREGLAPLVFDVDRDGDGDLLVTSGGSEFPIGSDNYQPLLFLNDGSGRMSAASQDALPELRFSGGAAVACDYDRDGDLDLFLGGRIVPGSYPLTPESALLRNDSDPGVPKLTNVTSELSPGLQTAGMVTGALWSDATGDGWMDLLVSYDWGPIRLFVNQQDGQLIDQTEKSGLSDHSGWFTGISGADLDGDGDIDYLVGNFGNNTKYHPSPETPARIYHADFDGSGHAQIVEAKVKKDHILPVRGKSCSQNAMPFIRKKFPTYEAFAKQDLDSIYPQSKLDEAFTVEASTLDSAILLNDGTGTFEFRPLPKLAQNAPVFGTAIVDLNGDRNPDIALAQNFFGPQRETGRFDGGLSLVLLGDGEGGFDPLWPDQSGISLMADATALVVMDLNTDMRPDLAIATNNGPVRAFLNQGQAAFRPLQLSGPPGNPTAVGAHLRVHYADGSIRSHESHCGGGYLSQSSPTLFLAEPKGTSISKIEVRWPDGSLTTHEAPYPEAITLTWPQS